MVKNHDKEIMETQENIFKAIKYNFNKKVTEAPVEESVEEEIKPL